MRTPRASPDANAITVGIESTSYRAAISGCSSMFSFANATPGTSCSSSPRIVSIARHGLHHGAQKSTATGPPAIAVSNVLASSSRIAPILETAGQSGETQHGHPRHGLEEDRAAHLRMSRRAVDEPDRHLDDGEAGTQRAVRS